MIIFFNFRHHVMTWFFTMVRNYYYFVLGFQNYEYTFFNQWEGRKMKLT